MHDYFTLFIDVVVVLVYFVVIIAIGLAKGAKEKSIRGFALGDRQIPWWAIVASILASEISAATFLGAPGEGFALRNFTYAQLLIGTILARLIVGWLFVKPLYENNVVSIYEFLEIRFGKLSRFLGSLTFLFTRALASGTRLYVAAIFLALGIELWNGTPLTDSQELAVYFGVLVLLVVATAYYTTLGGIKAVIWTDFIQAGILVISLVCSLWFLVAHIPGGVEGALSKLDQPTDLKFLVAGINPELSFWENVRFILLSDYTIFAALIGSTFITLATHGTDQDTVQRMLTGKSAKEGSKAVIWSGIIDAPIVFAFLSIGILLWVFYQYYPDPNLPDKNPHIFPYFILTNMPAGLRGLMVAALLATAMSTLSTTLNSLATSFSRDFYVPYFRPQANEAEKLKAVRMSSIWFAVVQVLIGAATAWVVVKMPSARILPIVLGVFGYTYGSLLGIFLVAILTKTRGNDQGNWIAMLAGLIFVALLTQLPQDFAQLVGWERWENPAWLPKISFPWRVLAGTLVTFSVACCFRTPKHSGQHVNAVLR